RPCLPASVMKRGSVRAYARPPQSWVRRLSAAAALAEALLLGLLRLEVGEDVGCRGVDDVFGFVEQRGDVLAAGLRLGLGDGRRQAAVLPADVDAPQFVLRAVIRTAPRCFR